MERPVFGPPNLFHQRLGNILDEAEMLKSGLSDYKQQGISKQDSLQNVDNMEVSIKRKMSNGLLSPVPTLQVWHIDFDMTLWDMNSKLIYSI